MAQNGLASSSSRYAHVPHDSELSVGSSKAEEDAAKIRDLEDEVRVLAERANTACTFSSTRVTERRDEGIHTNAQTSSATLRRLRERDPSPRSEVTAGAEEELGA